MKIPLSLLEQIVVQQFNRQFGRNMDVVDFSVQEIPSPIFTEYGYEFVSNFVSDNLRLRVYILKDYNFGMGSFRLETDRSTSVGDLLDEVFVAMCGMKDFAEKHNLGGNVVPPVDPVTPSTLLYGPYEISRTDPPTDFVSIENSDFGQSIRLSPDKTEMLVVRDNARTTGRQAMSGISVYQTTDTGALTYDSEIDFDVVTAYIKQTYGADNIVDYNTASFRVRDNFRMGNTGNIFAITCEFTMIGSDFPGITYIGQFDNVLVRDILLFKKVAGVWSFYASARSLVPNKTYTMVGLRGFGDSFCFSSDDSHFYMFRQVDNGTINDGFIGNSDIIGGIDVVDVSGPVPTIVNRIEDRTGATGETYLVSEFGCNFPFHDINCRQDTSAIAITHSTNELVVYNPTNKSMQFYDVTDPTNEQLTYILPSQDPTWNLGVFKFSSDDLMMVTGDSGKCYVYTRPNTASQFTFKQYLEIDDTLLYYYQFGTTVTISPNKEFIFVADPGYHWDRGAVFIYRLIGGDYVFYEKLDAFHLSDSWEFGCGVEYDQAKDFLYVGHIWDSVLPGVLYPGSVRTYSRFLLGPNVALNTPDAYIGPLETQTLADLNPVEFDKYGKDAGFSTDGKYLILSEPSEQTGVGMASTLYSRAFIYRRNNVNYVPAFTYQVDYATTNDKGMFKSVAVSPNGLTAAVKDIVRKELHILKRVGETWSLECIIPIQSEIDYATNLYPSNKSDESDSIVFTTDDQFVCKQLNGYDDTNRVAQHAFFVYNRASVGNWNTTSFQIDIYQMGDAFPIGKYVVHFQVNTALNKMLVCLANSSTGYFSVLQTEIVGDGWMITGTYDFSIGGLEYNPSQIVFTGDLSKVMVGFQQDSYAGFAQIGSVLIYSFDQVGDFNLLTTLTADVEQRDALRMGQQIATNYDGSIVFAITEEQINTEFGHVMVFQKNQSGLYVRTTVLQVSYASDTQQDFYTFLRKMKCSPNGNILAVSDYDFRNQGVVYIFQ